MVRFERYIHNGSLSFSWSIVHVRQSATRTFPLRVTCCVFRWPPCTCCLWIGKLFCVFLVFVFMFWCFTCFWYFSLFSFWFIQAEICSGRVTITGSKPYSVVLTLRQVLFVPFCFLLLLVRGSYLFYGCSYFNLCRVRLVHAMLVVLSFLCLCLWFWI